MMTYASVVKKDSAFPKGSVFEDFILSWAEKHITKPIQGFEQKTDPCGGYLSEEDRLTETHSQILHAARYFKKKNKPLHEIIDILSCFKK